MSFQLYCVTENKVSHWPGWDMVIVNYCALRIMRISQARPGYQHNLY